MYCRCSCWLCWWGWALSTWLQFAPTALIDTLVLQVLDAALSAQTVGLVTQEQYKRKLAQLQEEGVPTEAPKVSTCCLYATPPRHMWLWGCVRPGC